MSDYQDDYNLGQVTYASALTDPVQDAPAYVRAITLTPASPVGIETAAFEVLFSRKMDTSGNPVLPFSTVFRGAWQTYNTLNSGLASNNVLVAVADSYGNKWFGTLGSGVSTLRAVGLWQTYNTSNSGLANNQVHAVALDATGNKWFGRRVVA